MLASRVGMYICIDSTENDSNTPTPTAVANRADGRRSIPIRATKNPKGT